ncbi:hypothetical protein [Nonomuraea sp. NPDC049028]|uniref:hypothetical protein n=1 Tax=Nonomuraea sp. NPDC049028 TaxID=3364348 RepID=UPI00371C024B
MTALIDAVHRTRGGWRIPDQNLWTGEVEEHALAFAFDPAAGALFLTYENPRPADWERGLLWLRHGQDRSGAYKWRAINTPRTRRMMNEHLCMVCSGSCRQKKDGRTTWLFVDDPPTTPDGTPITNLPPTCPDCVPESLATCPRLSERARLVTVAKTRPFAVTADLYEPAEGFPAPAVKVRHEIHIPYGPETAYWLRFALGKQPWLALDDVRDQPKGRLRRQTPAPREETAVGRHEDANSPTEKEVTGKEGGTGSTNDQQQKPQGDHADGKGKGK